MDDKKVFPLKQFMIRLFALSLALGILFSGAGPISASAEETEPVQAVELTKGRIITGFTGFKDISTLCDGYLGWGLRVPAPASLTMESDLGIGSLYIRFAYFHGEYTIEDAGTGVSHVWQQKYLHDFVDLEALFGYAPTKITLHFTHDEVTIYELYAYSPGEVPADVQRWEDPVEGATDIIIFSTHGDDEHLFFAGIIPYYAGELGYQVQMVYMTDHHNNDGVTRMREILDGLWAAGMKTYPVFGTFDDFYRWGIDNAYDTFTALGISRDDLISFVTEQIRRFKPKAVIGHDFNGEYDNGQHMVYADVLAASVEISMDETQFPESAQKYGTWDVPKAYFHLYEENPIVMDWDQPLDHFGGKTAWQISKGALQKHVSQLEALLKTGWYFGDSWYAAYIGKYSPCRFGLYRSTVGEDVAKNDFFENLTTHAEDAVLAEAQRLAEEEAQRQAEEAARLKAEEEARQQAEEEARKASEEAARQESMAQETTAPQPTEAVEEADPILSLLAQFWYMPVLAVALLIIGMILLRQKGPKK